MNLTKSLLFASMSLFFITSCSKDENALTETQSENAAGSNNDIAYSYGNIVQSAHNKEQSGLSSRNTTFSSPWTEVTLEDLTKLSKEGIHYNRLDFIKNRFTWAANIGSRRPQSISFNDLIFGTGTNPNSKYGWRAKVRTVGSKIKTSETKKSPWTNASSIIKYRNNKGVREWMSYKGELRYTDTKKRDWSIGGSVSLEVGGEVKVPLLTEASTKLTVSFNGSRSGSKSTSTTEVIRSDVGQWVNPGQYINFVVEQSNIEVKTTWSIPLVFQGRVGADYGRKKHRGSHFWSVPASLFFYEYQDQWEKRILEVKESKDKVYRPKAWVTNY